ncbi:MAG: YkgJ family cysteine cluster protein [Rhodocyclales bacterium]|nr:YkgJ family cysteine cluster protein [Rhodocyclales bacterium]
MSPCQSCGACCATYRVSFPRFELDDVPGGAVPEALVESAGVQLVCMRGTAAAPARCVALRGAIGQSVSCAIYEFRPSACREFAPLAAVGRGDEACNDARRRHGLAPLVPAAA